jgi:hypothetical protein
MFLENTMIFIEKLVVSICVGVKKTMKNFF